VKIGDTAFAVEPKNGTSANEIVLITDEKKNAQVWKWAEQNFVEIPDTMGADCSYVAPDGSAAVITVKKKSLLYNINTGTSIDLPNTPNVSDVYFVNENKFFIQTSKTFTLWTIELDILALSYPYTIEKKLFSGLCDVTVSPTGDYFVCQLGDENNKIGIFSTNPENITKHVIDTPEEDESSTMGTFKWSPSGKRVAVSSDNHVILIEVPSMKTRILENKETNSPAFEWVDEDVLLFDCSTTSTIRIADLSQDEVQYKDLVGHQNTITNFVLNSDKTTLFSYSAKDRKILVWDLASNNCVHTFAGHTQDLKSVIYYPNGNMITSCSADKTVRFWNLAEIGKVTTRAHTMETIATEIVNTAKEQHLVMFHKDASVWCVEIQSGRLIWKEPGAKVPYDHTIAIAPNFSFFAGVEKTVVHLWKRNQLMKNNVPVRTGFFYVRALKGHLSDLYAAAFSHDGKLLATASDGPEYATKIWNTETLECIHNFERTSDAKDMWWNADATLLLSVERQATLEYCFNIWSLKIGLMSTTKLSGNMTGVLHPSFPHYAIENQIVDVSSGLAGKVIAELEGANISCTFSHNGMWLATLDESKIRLYEYTQASSGKEESNNNNEGQTRTWNFFASASHNWKLSSSSGTVVAFSLDYKWISVSSANTVSIFEIDQNENTLTHVTKLKGHNHLIKKIVWFVTKDKLTALSTIDNSGVMKIWDLRIDFTLRWTDEVLLNLENTNIDEVEGLDTKTRRLMEQRGSVGVPKFRREEFGDWSDFHWEVLNEDLEKVTASLEKDPSLVNSLTPAGDTALHIAAQYGLLDVAAILMAHGADYAIKDSNGRIPGQVAADFSKKKMFSVVPYLDRTRTNYDFLLCAAADGNLDVVKRVKEDLKNGKELPQPEEKPTTTALHVTSEPDIVNYLVSQGSDVNALDKKGKTPLHIMARFGRKSAIVALMKFKPKLDALSRKKDTVLHLSMRSKHLPTVEYLLALPVYKGVINAKGKDSYSPLLLALMQGCNADIIALLLKNGANPNQGDDKGICTPIGEAVSNKLSPEILDMLLKAGAKVTDDAMRDAVCSNLSVLDTLVKHGTKIPDNLLLEADSVEAATYVLQRRPELLEFPDRKSGKTPLQKACECREIPLIAYYLSKKANPNTVTKDGNTALLFFADSGVEDGDVKTFQLLINNGADVNAVNKKCENALSLVKKEKKQKAVTEFFEKLIKTPEKYIVPDDW
jgi:ankyrin repeat protein